MLVTFAIKNKVIKNLDNLFKEINLYNEKKFNVINLFKIMYLMNRMDNLKNMNNLVLKNHLTKSYHYSKRRLFIHLPSIIYGMSSQALGGSILAIFLYLVYITTEQLAAIMFFIRNTLLISCKFLSRVNFAKKLGLNHKNNISIKNIAMIDINSFNINYHGGFKKDIDIKIFKDKKYFIHGKSGIGESAMLKNIIGINNEYSGNIIMKNKNVEHNIKNISIT